MSLFERHGGVRGGCRTPTYNVWLSMRARVLNPKHAFYPIYGGRGVRICERWLASFADFRTDMGERPAGHTLDRVNAEGDYEPGNCQWATRSQQNRNRRPFPRRHCRCGYFAGHACPCQERKPEPWNDPWAPRPDEAAA